jgi:Glycosyl transferase family 2
VNSHPDNVNERARRVLEENRVAIFIVAYNAERHIKKVLERIPTWVAERLTEIFVIDDRSSDNTFAVATKVEWPSQYAPLKIFRTPYNQGYGGNQRLGYLYAIEQGFDIVVLLHGDGQIEIDQAVNTSKLGISGENRDLGFGCNLLQWAPAPGAKSTVFSPDQFLGSGWYRIESNGGEYLLWSEQRAIVRLPPIEGDGRLQLTMHAPIHPDGTVSDVTVEVSGKVIDKFRPTGANWVTKIIRIPEAVHRRMRAELVLSTDNPVILPNSDNRRVGEAFSYIGWRPSE